MNLTYTLTPQEIAQRHPRPRKSTIGHRLVDKISSSLFIAMAVAALAMSMSLSPRVAVGLMTVVIGTSLYNARAELVGFRARPSNVPRPTDPMDVRVDAGGISTVRGAERTSSRWSSLVRVQDTSEGVSLVFIDGTVRWVPMRAFGSPDDHRTFLNFTTGLVRPVTAAVSSPEPPR